MATIIKSIADTSNNVQESNVTTVLQRLVRCLSLYPSQDVTQTHHGGILVHHSLRTPANIYNSILVYKLEKGECSYMFLCLRSKPFVSRC